VSRFLLAAVLTSFVVSCAPTDRPDPEGDRAAWTKKDEKADKVLKNDERGLVKSGEYQPNWQF